jgi:PKD repeat protein
MSQAPGACTQILSKSLVVNNGPEVQIFSAQDFGLMGDADILTASVLPEEGNYKYLWNTGSKNPWVPIFSLGTYSVTVTDRATGCKGIDSYVEDVFSSCDENIVFVDTCIGGSGGPKPVANFTVSNSEGCGPLTVQFSDFSSNNPTSWLWSFPGGELAPGSSNTSQNPVVIYKHTGHFPASLIATNANGSSNTFSISNVVYVKGMAPQILSVSADPPQIWPGEVSELSVDVSGSGSYAYQWSHGGTLNNSNHQHPVAQPSVTTPYIVQVTDNNTECVSFGYVTLVVIGTVANRELDPSKITVSLSEGGVMINADFDQYVVSLVDIIGRELKHQLCNQKETIVSTNDLPAGFYAVRIFAENKMHVIPITVIH